MDQPNETKQLPSNNLDQENDLLASIVRSTEDAILSIDLKGNILTWNTGAEKVYGYARQDVISRPISLIIPPVVSDHVFKIYEMIKQGKRITHFETVRVQKDGLRIDVSVTVSPVRNAEGRIVGISEIGRDITHHKIDEEEQEKAKDNLEEEKLKLIQTLNLYQALMSIVDLDDVVEFVMDKVIDILDAQRCSLMFIDQDYKRLSIRGARGLSRNIVRTTKVKLGDGIAGTVVQRGKPLLVQDIEYDQNVSQKNKRVYKSKSFVSVPVRLKGRIVGVVNVTDKNSSSNGVFTTTDLEILSAIIRQAEIAFENTHLYKELRYQSMTDPLTGVFNHRFFVKCLSQEIKRINRYPGSLCLMMIDIDGFKEYNDTYGHVEGDILIKTICNILRENLRRVDILCRYGGDEFAVILTGTDVSQAEVAAEKLREAVAKTTLKKGVTLSIGIAPYADEMERYELVMKADQALYEAKRTGKNRICCA